MSVHSVKLSRGGDNYIEVNPLMVGAIEPCDREPASKSVINVFGVRYKVRGHIDAIRARLGWDEFQKVEPVAPPADTLDSDIDSPPAGSAGNNGQVGEPSELT